MAAVFKSRIVKIGNSQGIRIPKPLLDQAGLEENVEIEVEEGRIIIRPSQKPRQGWEEQFLIMAERGEDRLLDESELPYLVDRAEEDWTW